MADDTIGVYAVDDAPSFLRSVGLVVAAVPGFTLVGIATTGFDAIGALLHRCDVDIVLLDVHLPDLSGIEVARRLDDAGHRALVVLMSTTDPADLPADALSRGVAGFLPKEQLTTAWLRSTWDHRVP
jgi:DNA-binding NarL/FixJ family response regulator